MVDFETPLPVQTLFIVYFCRCCQKKRKKEKKVLLSAGVSKSTVCDHSLIVCISCAIARTGIFSEKNQNFKNYLLRKKTVEA
jgi:hypothetical protein